MFQLSGALDLVCSRDEVGRTYLSRQSFNVPFHIGKPYWTGDTLLVQVINPTAGLFSTDRLSSRIELEPRTSAAVTTPSATRIYPASSDRTELRQGFVVGEGAWLDYSPAMLIPQAGSRCRQVTRIELEKGAAAFYLESLAPGRVASGESLAFESLEWESDVFYDGRLILRECFRLQPGDGSFLALQKPMPNAFFASGFIVSDSLERYREIASALREACCEEVLVGLSPLENYFWTVRILSSSSVKLRRCIRHLRSLIGTICPQISVTNRGNV